MDRKCDLEDARWEAEFETPIDQPNPIDGVVELFYVSINGCSFLALQDSYFVHKPPVEPCFKCGGPCNCILPKFHVFFFPPLEKVTL